MTNTPPPALTRLDVTAKVSALDVPVLAYALDGKATGADIDAVKADLDNHETVRMLLRVDEFAMPDASALSRKMMAMEADALKKIERYAVVGGPSWIAGCTGVVSSVTPFAIKHFDDESAAWAWIGGGPTEDEAEEQREAEYQAAPAVTLLDTDRPDLVAFAVDGYLTEQDYRSVVDPAIEAAVREYDAIDLLVRFDEMGGFSFGAVKEDAALAGHMGSFRRFALVSGPDWLKGVVDTFGALVPVEVEMFGTESEARSWLSA